MEFNEYQRLALTTAVYPNRGHNVVYPAMGLSGESGECCDKVKKEWRNNDNMDGNIIAVDKRAAIISEMGDVLWYLAAMCSELNIDLDFVADTNLDKLFARRERGLIKGEGDER